MTWLAIRALLGRIPAAAWAVAAALAYGAFQHHRATAAGSAALKAQTELAELRANAAQAAIDTLARKVAATTEAVNAARTSEAIATAGAAAADSALRRLRDRAANAGAGCTSSAAATGGQATGAATAMPADVLGRVGEAAGQLAIYADAARRAGLACEAIASP